MPTKKTEAELKRNTLSIRLTDDQHDTVSSAAWKRKSNCSELIRSITLEQLKREEGQAKQPQTV